MGIASLRTFFMNLGLIIMAKLIFILVPHRTTGKPCITNVKWYLPIDNIQITRQSLNFSWKLTTLVNLDYIDKTNHFRGKEEKSNLCLLENLIFLKQIDISSKLNKRSEFITRIHRKKTFLNILFLVIIYSSN